MNRQLANKLLFGSGALGLIIAFFVFLASSGLQSQLKTAVSLSTGTPNPMVLLDEPPPLDEPDPLIDLPPGDPAPYPPEPGPEPDPFIDIPPVDLPPVDPVPEPGPLIDLPLPDPVDTGINPADIGPADDPVDNPLYVCVNRWIGNNWPYDSGWTRPPNAPAAGKPFCTNRPICKNLILKNQDGRRYVDCRLDDDDPANDAATRLNQNQFGQSQNARYFLQYGYLLPGTQAAGYPARDACVSACRAAISAYIDQSWYPQLASQLNLVNRWQLLFFTRFLLYPRLWYGI